MLYNMTEMASSIPQELLSRESKDSDRRVGVRFPRRLEMLWQFLGVKSPDLITATVVDLSLGGVGLLVNRPFDAEDRLVLRLPSVRHGWATHLVRVRHCKEILPGEYLAGCAFVRPLQPTELTNLLG